jgi:gamma-butyrobetaine dioxygenase
MAIVPAAPEVRIGPDNTTLVVAGPDNPPFSIHALWLRERCRDAASLDAQTEQRLYNPSDLDPAPQIAQVTRTKEGAFLVSFRDGAIACLTAAQILAELPASADQVLPTPCRWTTSLPLPPSFDWRACHGEAAQLAALHDFLLHGYIILHNVPSRSGAVLEVARHFGFPRETNFGMLFDVRSVPEANDLAYTSLPLDPHTDNPYRAPVPGIQLLHCLTNRTPGGLSTLVDGLAVAEAMRAEAPPSFAILATTPVRFRYVDAETELVASAKLIELDAAGQFAAIHYSPRLDFVPLLPPHALEMFYYARRLLDGMLKSEKFERRFRLDDGDLMMFDNRRLLHGRTGFDPRTGLRHLQGCYIDADGPRSRYRVLHRSVP